MDAEKEPPPLYQTNVHTLTRSIPPSHNSLLQTIRYWFYSIGDSDFCFVRGSSLRRRNYLNSDIR
jgi:hypothetical protein